MKVLVTSNSFGKYSKAPVKKLEEYGFEIIWNKYHRMMDEDEFIEQLKGVDAVILSTEKVTKKVIDSSPDLKMISRYGVGLDNIDLEYCKEKNIEVTVTKGGNSNAVAEYAVSLMLASLRGIPFVTNESKKGNWKKFTGMDISGKTVGIIGLGSIGKIVATMISGFNVQILAYDVFYDDEFIKTHNIKKCTIAEIAELADVITLHAPAIDGKPILGKNEFEKMKQGVVIVNTARASLIDFNSLIENLDNGKVFAAALDVHENEPQFEPELLKYENVILTPHNAAITKEATDKTSMMAVDNLINYFERRK